MKTSIPAKQHFFYLLMIAIAASSCASFQYTSYHSDGGYDRYASEQPYSSQGYQDYFAYKSQQYATPSDGQGEVFTDIDAYSSTSVNTNVDIVADYGYGYDPGNSYPGWGSAVTNVSVNVIPVYNWGWSNWGWNSWYGNPYYYYGYNGWYNPYWGYYSPVWRPNWGWGGWSNGFYGSVWP
ncbi:MAG: hypothetical protein KDD04_10675, partial [Sinomicrobium sp.]|nr:hypothetical protein [Sinomicrobium sp.]